MLAVLSPLNAAGVRSTYLAFGDAVVPHRGDDLVEQVGESPVRHRGKPVLRYQVVETGRVVRQHDALGVALFAQLDHAMGPLG
jgi:hypothetical protein